MKAGTQFELSSNSEILKINSPKKNIGGPYAVVYKNTESRWVLSVLTWDNKPHLGIRWFWGSSGMPTSRGHSTWHVIPAELATSILNGLPLDSNFRSKIDEFLSGKIDGKVISHWYKSKTDLS